MMKLASTVLAFEFAHLLLFFVCVQFPCVISYNESTQMEGIVEKKKKIPMVIMMIAMNVMMVAAYHVNMW